MPTLRDVPGSRRAYAAPMPLFLELLDGHLVRPAEVEREPGDEAVRLVELRYEDGHAVLAADCFDWQECECPEWLASGDCCHLTALRRAALFKTQGQTWEGFRERSTLALAEGGRR